MDFVIERHDLISMLMSILCGSLIGLEREYKNKSTGLRTIILICLGSTIFTIVSRHGAGADDRISANIITGIGFIGAGVIFKEKFSVLGLTTAAVIWTTAAIGMTTGIGYHALAFVFTIFTLIILLLVNKVEDRINRLQKKKVFTITFSKADIKWLQLLEEKLAMQQLQCKRLQVSKVNSALSVILLISGNPVSVDKLIEQMAAMEEITDFYGS